MKALVVLILFSRFIHSTQAGCWCRRDSNPPPALQGIGTKIDVGPGPVKKRCSKQRSGNVDCYGRKKIQIDYEYSGWPKNDGKVALASQLFTFTWSKEAVESAANFTIAVITPETREKKPVEYPSYSTYAYTLPVVGHGTYGIILRGYNEEGNLTSRGEKKVNTANQFLNIESVGGYILFKDRTQLAIFKWNHLQFEHDDYEITISSQTQPIKQSGVVLAIPLPALPATTWSTFIDVAIQANVKKKSGVMDQITKPAKVAKGTTGETRVWIIDSDLRTDGQKLSVTGGFEENKVTMDWTGHSNATHYIIQIVHGDTVTLIRIEGNTVAVTLTETGRHDITLAAFAGAEKDSRVVAAGEAKVIIEATGDKEHPISGTFIPSDQLASGAIEVSAVAPEAEVPPSPPATKSHDSSPPSLPLISVLPPLTMDGIDDSFSDHHEEVTPPPGDLNAPKPVGTPNVLTASPDEDAKPALQPTLFRPTENHGSKHFREFYESSGFLVGVNYPLFFGWKKNKGVVYDITIQNEKNFREEHFDFDRPENFDDFDRPAIVLYEQGLYTIVIKVFLKQTSPQTETRRKLGEKTLHVYARSKEAPTIPIATELFSGAGPYNVWTIQWNQNEGKSYVIDMKHKKSMIDHVTMRTIKEHNDKPIQIEFQSPLEQEFVVSEINYNKDLREIAGMTSWGWIRVKNHNIASEKREPNVKHITLNYEPTYGGVHWDRVEDVDHFTIIAFHGKIIYKTSTFWRPCMYYLPMPPPFTFTVTAYDVNGYMIGYGEHTQLNTVEEAQSQRSLNKKKVGKKNN